MTRGLPPAVEDVVGLHIGAAHFVRIMHVFRAVHLMSVVHVLAVGRIDVLVLIVTIHLAPPAAGVSKGGAIEPIERDEPAEP
jgi:hypothetical protein